MKTLKSPFSLFLVGLLLTLITCTDRESTNPFDANCPKELFTPSDFKADQESNGIKLSWKQTNTNISGFVISRNENDGAMTEVTRVDKTVTSWNDSNVKGGTKYGYRLAAYAGDNLSNDLTAFFTPVYGATVTTDAVSGIASTTAIMGGNVTNEGGAPVTERGVCYSTNLNPTTADKKAEMGSGSGAFNLAITGLTSGNTYYARAYATNSKGTTYGNQVTFTTSFLTVTPASYSVTKEGGSREFSVTSNIDWQVSADQTWCTLSAKNGKGTGSITLSFPENKEVPQRTATLTFIGPGVATQTTSLTQAGTEPPVLTITPANQNVTNTAGTTTFTITSNVSWTAKSDQAWCKIVNSSGTGNATLIVNYEANTSNSQRVATVTVTGLGLDAKTVTVKQHTKISNVALANNGAIATAISVGSYDGTRHAFYAIDGDSLTFWASNWSMPGWLKVQFSNTYTITKVGVWNGEHKHTFKISLSTDGNNWIEVVSPRLSLNGEGEKSKPKHELFEINPTQAKFIKCDITTTSAPGSHIFQSSLHELEAYGY